MTFEPRQRFVDSQRIPISYWDWGNEEAPPLVLVHGGRDHARSWGRLAEELRTDYHVVALDLRGHGDSGWTPGGNYSLPDNALDVVRVIETVGAPARVIAHSYGGSICLLTAGTYPEYFSALAVIEGTHSLNPPDQERVDPAWVRRWGDRLRSFEGQQPRVYATLEDAEERMREATTLAEMFRSIDELPKFVIGVVVGPAFGGGVGLAAVCDVVIAGSDAKFALSETRLGLIPATIAPYLHRRIGAAAMRRLALHGEAFCAAQAMSIGLVSYAVDEGDIEAMTERQIAQALICAPGAVADAKSLFRKIASGSAGEAEMVAALVRRWSAEEARTGIAAFFKREKAPWQR